MSAPTEDPAEAEFLAVCGPWLDHPRSWADNARLAPDRISHVVRSIAESEPAVLAYCAGGRDRSGMVSAMLLQLAGVTPEGIAADYADGWRGAAAYSGHFWVYDHGQREWAHRHEAAPDPTDTERRLAERIPAVLDWCSSFDTTSYLTSVGLAEPDIARLRALLQP